MSTHSLTRAGTLLLGCVVLLAIVVAALLLGRGGRDREAIYVAVVGPKTGAQAPAYVEMVRGISLQLEEVNDAGGIAGARINLLQYDDANDPEMAVQQARKIVADGRALVVLRHHYSETSLAAAPIYDDAGLSLVTGSATASALARLNEHVFRVTYGDHRQASFLASYARRELRKGRVAVIHEGDTYGESLRRQFTNASRSLGGEVMDEWSLDVSRGERQERIEEIVDQLVAARQRNREPDLLFLATHRTAAVDLIASIRRQGLSYPIFGSGALADPRLMDELAEFPEEQTRKGRLTDDVHASAPIIYEVASPSAQDFRARYMEKHGTAPGWLAATYHDAGLVAVHAMRAAGIPDSGRSRAGDLQAIRNGLARIRSRRTAVPGLTGAVFFDVDGDRVGIVPIGRYEQRRFVPASTALSPLADPAADKVEAALGDGDTLVVGGQLLRRTTVVYTGIEINDISDIDSKTATFTVNFDLWFRYPNTADVPPVWNVELINATQPVSFDDPIEESCGPELCTRVHRLRATFAGHFYFRDYPFDTQTLSFGVRHTTLERDQVIFVPDVVRMGDIDRASMLDRLRRADALAALPSWRLVGAAVYQDVVDRDQDADGPRTRAADSGAEFSRFNVALEVRREAWSFAAKNLVPVLVVLVIAYLALFLPPDQLSPRLSIGVSALLSTAFFHLRLSSDLPQIGYVLAIEYVFYTLYGLTALGIFITVRSYVEHIRGTPESARRITRLTRLGKVVTPAAVAGLVAFFGSEFALFDRLKPAPRHSTQVAATPEATTKAGPLTLGSWRVDDIAEVRKATTVFTHRHPEIELRFVPTADFDTLVHSALERGTAPDLLYLRPYSWSRPLFAAGYLASLERLGLTERFEDEDLAPWTSVDGQRYGVPVMAVAHAVFYNADLLAEAGVDVPRTWGELLETARGLKAAGYEPFANGSADQWEPLEVLFMSLAPNFIGGRDGRRALLEGERCFDDDRVVAAFAAVAALSEFLPAGHATILFDEGRERFASGGAAMWMSGSWEVRRLLATGRDAVQFEWGVFSMPPPEGTDGWVVVQPDFAIGVNADSPRQDGARQFLRWVASDEGGAALAQELPGFFPLLRSHAPSGADLAHPGLNALAAFLASPRQDMRLGSEALNDGVPSGHALMRDGVAGVIRGDLTPEQAASRLQNGLAQWFKPAQECRRDPGDRRDAVGAGPGAPETVASSSTGSER